MHEHLHLQYVISPTWIYLHTIRVRMHHIARWIPLVIAIAYPLRLAPVSGRPGIGVKTLCSLSRWVTQLRLAAQLGQRHAMATGHGLCPWKTWSFHVMGPMENLRPIYSSSGNHPPALRPNSSFRFSPRSHLSLRTWVRASLASSFSLGPALEPKGATCIAQHVGNSRGTLRCVGSTCASAKNPKVIAFANGDCYLRVGEWLRMGDNIWQ